MTKEEFDKLSEAEKRHVASEYRKTSHKGEAFIHTDINYKPKTLEEKRRELELQKLEVLSKLESSSLEEGSPRRGR